MDPRVRKRWFNVVRITLCAAALAVVVQGVTLRDHVVLREGGEHLVGTVVREDGPVTVRTREGALRSVPRADVAVDPRGEPRIEYGLRTAWHRSEKWLLFLAVAIHFPVVLPQSLRLQWMLRAQDVRVHYWECLKLSFAGNFLNFATPLGSHLGDVFKAYFVSQHTERKTEAATTVFLDRLVGLGSLLLVVALITTLSPSDSHLASFRPYMLGMFGAGVAGAMAYLSATLRRHLLPRAWLERLPMIGQLQRIDRTARVLARRKATLLAAVLLTVVLQAVAIGAYFTVAVALALDAGWGNVLEYYTYFYTGVLVQALPGPPQGLGTVELAYSYFLAPFGSPSQIVCVALAIRLVALTCALPGLLVTLTGSYRPRDIVRLNEADLAAALPPSDAGRELPIG